MSPFRNILKLSVGDFLAKTLYFAAFVYMAQVLEVVNYGVLEFAVAIRMYLLLLADTGLEIWAVREVARGQDARLLAGCVAPLRLLLSTVAYSTVNGVLAALPDNPNLRVVLPVFALTVFVQAFNLKWVFMGQGRMSRVAVGLVLSQIAFAAPIFVLVRKPEDIVWVAPIWLVSEILMVVYFGWLFATTYGGFRISLTLQGARKILFPALTLGASQGLALLNYNLGSVLLGLMLGPAPVGWYAAAYKPITAILSMPVSYFLGLFPTLARHYTNSREQFGLVLERSLRLTAILAVPLGIATTMMAGPIVRFLFGEYYQRSVEPLQLLGWSATLVILRGNFRQGLNAAGLHRLDLRCAGVAVTLNLALNLLLIPKYELVGAALATVLSEIVWFSMAAYLFSRHVMPARLLTVLWRPALAAMGMALALWASEPLFWLVRALLGGIVYITALAALGEKEIWSRLPRRRLEHAAGFEPAIKQTLSK